MQWVLDASVALAWCFEDERTDLTEALFDRLETSPAVAPQNWPLEMANALALAARSGRLPSARRAQFLATLDGLPIHLDDAIATHAFGATLALADTHRLTTYDAAYLELAMRLGVPLATLDQDLRAAAQSVGVSLL